MRQVVRKARLSLVEPLAISAGMHMTRLHDFPVVLLVLVVTTARLPSSPSPRLGNPTSGSVVA